MALLGHKIVAIRAYVVEGGGADYHDQKPGHWIVGQIATPMSIYSEYKATRSSFGLNALKTLVVEVEADNGITGFGITTGGYPAAWLVMNHLDRFVIGKDASDVEITWDQMYRASLYYGRKGIVMNAISCIDLALWDLRGKLQDEPVHAMIGGKVRDELKFYATGPKPDKAKELGFIGGKIPLVYGPDDGMEGLQKEINRAADIRAKVGNEFMLMWDCWMALDLPYAKRLLTASEDLNFEWIEECFNPDDYWSYRDLKKYAQGKKILVTGGEHEASKFGFRMLLEQCDIDVIQPDVGWCGGITELIKIGALAAANGKWVIPHGSGVYSYQYVCTLPETVSPFTELLMQSHDADKVVPQYYPLLQDLNGNVEPLPTINNNGNRTIRVSDEPGFGVQLNKKAGLIEIEKHTGI